MRCINSWDELLDTAGSLRNKGLALTNFYPNEPEMTEWIEKKAFFFLELDSHSSCFVHKTEDASFLFFCLEDMAFLSGALRLVRGCLPEETLAFDWICRSDEESELLGAQSASGGFSLRTSLRRMSRLLKENAFADVPGIVLADEQDAGALQAMFRAAFDPLSERIPSKEQLLRYIRTKSVLVKRTEGGELAGFAVIDVQKKTMHLKHLLTASGFRRQGVAGSLLGKAFFMSKECIRYILWVIADNLPAISLYEKFGYQFEALRNYTYVSG